MGPKEIPPEPDRRGHELLVDDLGLHGGDDAVVAGCRRLAPGHRPGHVGQRSGQSQSGGLALHEPVEFMAIEAALGLVRPDAKCFKLRDGIWGKADGLRVEHPVSILRWQPDQGRQGVLEIGLEFIGIVAQRPILRR